MARLAVDGIGKYRTPWTSIAMTAMRRAVTPVTWTMLSAVRSPAVTMDRIGLACSFLWNPKRAGPATGYSAYALRAPNSAKDRPKQTVVVSGSATLIDTHRTLR